MIRRIRKPTAEDAEDAEMTFPKDALIHIASFPLRALRALRALCG